MTTARTRVLIVDDEPLARERIRTLLADEPGFEIVGEATDGTSGAESILALQPDLVFLDVQMPGADGFDVIDAVGADKMPFVVFVTAHDRYALKAFDVHALDYLLKPFDKARFSTALERAKTQLRHGTAAALDQRLQELLQTVEGRRHGAERLMVKSGGRITFVRIADIDWIEAAGNYVRLHVGKEDHLLRESLAALEKKLDAGLFVRVHRSTIVNLDRIREIQPAFHGDYVIVLRDG